MVIINKVILMGRLTKDPEMRYSQGAEPLAIARYTLAVNRRFKNDEADFINCTAFGKTAEFVEKYFSKGKMMALVGRIQVRSYDDNDGNRKWITEVIVEEVHFCGSKGDVAPTTKTEKPIEDKFVPVDENGDDDDLPF